MIPLTRYRPSERKSHFSRFGTISIPKLRTRFHYDEPPGAPRNRRRPRANNGARLISQLVPTVRDNPGVRVPHARNVVVKIQITRSSTSWSHTRLPTNLQDLRVGHVPPSPCYAYREVTMLSVALRFLRRN